MKSIRQFGSAIRWVGRWIVGTTWFALVISMLVYLLLAIISGLLSSALSRDYGIATRNAFLWLTAPFVSTVVYSHCIVRLASRMRFTEFGVMYFVAFTIQGVFAHLRGLPPMTITDVYLATTAGAVFYTSYLLKRHRVGITPGKYTWLTPLFLLILFLGVESIFKPNFAIEFFTWQEPIEYSRGR